MAKADPKDSETEIAIELILGTLMEDHEGFKTMKFLPKIFSPLAPSIFLLNHFFRGISLTGTKQDANQKEKILMKPVTMGS